MPRRKVRKLKSTPRLERHYVELSQLTPENLLSRLFAHSVAGPDAPVEFELGSGKGLFLRNFAARHPERNFLGNEVAPKYALFAAGQLAQRELTNAVMIQGDGLRLLREFLPTESLAAVHVYFPDPWWKARHKKRRVLTPASLRDIQRVLLPGGKLHFWTDVQEYYETSIELMMSVTQLRGPVPMAEPPALHDLDYRTHFERRTRQAGEPVFRCWFEK
ncbi:MAG: tRNA (guanosine(46)-N7)-methyltransferase TrmB [Pirellulales bacterium]|nr:tRNA (guanosine(46)-N7)-methyltransferase TrmB [Pirellulales bacterium]